MLVNSIIISSRTVIYPNVFLLIWVSSGFSYHISMLLVAS